ncbi:MAG: carbohydrate ABC transporter permease [Clostridia bacterium]|nr:carbohydrate ABC transporter permease [Clostridia bacterium]
MLVTTKKQIMQDRAIDFVLYTGLLIIFVLMIYPFLNVLAISLNEPMDTIRGNIFIIPRKFTLFTYSQVLFDKKIFNSSVISVLRTIIGTLVNVTACTVFGYILSRKDFIFRKLLTVMLIITMYTNPGIIPNYFLIRNLGLLNNFMVYIIPYFISAFSVIVARTYIEGLPESFVESAKMDGAKELTIIFRIIFPLVLPMLATIALFAAIFHWNSWMDTYLYASRNQYLSTLQFELQKIIQSTNQSAASSGAAVEAARKLGRVTTPQAVKAAISIIALIPIVAVYPFVQKYFIAGLTIGGVKE